MSADEPEAQFTLEVNKPSDPNKVDKRAALAALCVVMSNICVKKCYECGVKFDGYHSVCGKDECDNCGKCWCDKCENEEYFFPSSADWDEDEFDIDDDEDYEFPPCKYCVYYDYSTKRFEKT